MGIAFVHTIFSSMKPGFIKTGDQRLQYLQWGSGKKLLIALHGYGNNARMFEGLAAMLASDYTIVALNLPYHGESEWNRHEPWMAVELVEMIGLLMKAHNVEACSLTGYSLGGRICLKLLELMPARILQVTLLAPDGLVPNKMYRFVTANPAGKRIFSHFLDKPDGYMKVLGWMERKRLLDPAKKRFMDQYVSEATTRQFLKKVWPNLGALVPNPQKVRNNITAYNIPVHLFVGKHDRVILLPHALTFASEMPLVFLHVLDKGHRVMDSDSMGEISKSLLNG